MPNEHETDNRANTGDGSTGALNQATSAGGTSVERVSVRLPAFWPEEPDVWFAQAEAQFKISGVKDESTKFYHIIAQLEHKYAREVKDLIKNPPKEKMYEKLKQELIKRLSSSREQQMRQLLTHEELGDRKPSQFLRHLRTLAAGGVSDEFLRSLWSSRLPTHVQAIIASQSSASLDDVAELADKICEVANIPSGQVASTSVDNYDGLLRRLDVMITNRIQSELSKQISQLGVHTSRPSRRDGSRSRSGSRNRSRSRTPGMCWYHSIFREKARKCTKPCNYQPVNNSGSQ